MGLWLPRYEVEVVGNEPASESVRRLSLRLPEPVAFEPGDHVILTFGGLVPRHYSIANRHSPTDVLELLVSLAGRGVGARTVRDLPLGTRLRLDGPTGEFRYRPSPEGESWFLATSTGMAPFIPMSRAAANAGERVRMYLGAKTPDRLVRLAEPHYDVRYAVTRPDDAWSGPTGRIDAVVAEALAAAPPQVNRRAYYVCGLPKMVRSTIRALRQAGVDERRIAFEPYG